jgi:hypothetical protein
LPPQATSASAKAAAPRAIFRFIGRYPKSPSVVRNRGRAIPLITGQRRSTAIDCTDFSTDCAQMLRPWHFRLGLPRLWACKARKAHALWTIFGGI